MKRKLGIVVIFILLAMFLRFVYVSHEANRSSKELEKTKECIRYKVDYNTNFCP